MAVNALVAVCKGEIKGATVPDRVTAANALLDRGYGKPVQSVDMLLIGKKIAALSDNACDHFTVML